MITELIPETKYTYCIYARTKNDDTYGSVGEFVTGTPDEFTIDMSSIMMRLGNKGHSTQKDWAHRACTVTNPYLEAGNVLVLNQKYKMIGALTSSNTSEDRTKGTWSLTGSSFIPGVFIIPESGYYMLSFVYAHDTNKEFEFELDGATLDNYITVYEGVATHSVTNYSLPYTEWNWSIGLENQIIEEDSFCIDIVTDTTQVKQQARLGWRIKLSESPFKVGDIIYFGIEDFEKEGGSIYLSLRDKKSQRLGYVSVATRKPITYIVMEIVEETELIEIAITRPSSEDYTHFSGGRSFLTTEPFHEETIWKEADDVL